MSAIAENEKPNDDSTTATTEEETPVVSKAEQQVNKQMSNISDALTKLEEFSITEESKTENEKLMADCKSIIAENSKRKDEEKKRLATISVQTSDVSLLVDEFEMPVLKANSLLKEHNGNLASTITHLMST
eukprot:g1879.t1